MVFYLHSMRSLEIKNIAEKVFMYIYVICHALCAISINHKYKGNFYFPGKLIEI
jgi:hypothetical protein